MTEQPNGTNGNPLPATREVAIEQGLRFFNETAAERDALAAEVAKLKIARAGDQVAIDVLQAQLNEMQSRVNTAVLQRDQAVADRAKWESLFISMQAQLRAFQVPSAPLVRAIEDEPPLNTIGGA